MSGRYKAYPQYKESGIEWIGQIPDGWIRSYLGFECSVKARLGWKGLKAEEYVDEGFVFLATPNIKGKEVDFENVDRITQRRYAESPEIMLEEGDVLVTKDGSTTGTTNLIRRLPEPATVNSSIAVLRTLGRINSSYLFYFFTSEYIQSVINRMRGGMGVPHLFQADLRKFEVLIPPLSEQIQIAAFLDHETAKIDRLIEKQQELIRLLKEKRQAVISHAVTKGLNSNAPLKDSGVEWLGQVPEHWKSGKLGYSAKISNGATPSRENTAFWHEGTIGWLNSGKINDEVIYEADQFITKLAVKQTSVQSIAENDLLIAITGEGQTRGRVAICKTRATINQHLASISVNHEQLSYEYVFYWLTSQYERIRLESEEGGSTKAAITCTSIAAYPVPIPPMEEQIKIASFVARQRERLDKLIELASDQITLLQERRTALISAAVTGKIDVRHWQSASRDAQSISSSKN